MKDVCVEQKTTRTRFAIKLRAVLIGKRIEEGHVVDDHVRNIWVASLLTAGTAPELDLRG